MRAAEVVLVEFDEVLNNRVLSYFAALMPFS